MSRTRLIEATVGLGLVIVTLMMQFGLPKVRPRLLGLQPGFDAFLDPHCGDRLDFSRACIVGEKLIFRGGEYAQDPHLRQLDLKTGQITPLPGLLPDYVFADGDDFWRVRLPRGTVYFSGMHPEFFGGDSNLPVLGNARQIYAVFRWRGDLWAIVEAIVHVDSSYPYEELHLYRYASWEWKLAGRLFEPVPGGDDGHTVNVVVANDEASMFWRSTGEGEVWFCRSIDRSLISVDENGELPVSAMCPKNAFSDEPEPYGWVSLPESYDVRPVQNGYVRFGDDPMALSIQFLEGRFDAVLVLHRWFASVGDDATYRHESHEFSIQDRWPQKLGFEPVWDEGKNGGAEWFVVPRSDGRCPIVLTQLTDGRIWVYELTESSLRPFRKWRGPLVQRVLIQGTVYFLLALIIPMVALGFLGSFAKRFIPAGELADVPQLIEAAPLGRRGIARAVDLGLILTLPLMLATTDIDFAGWWAYAYGEYEEHSSAPEVGWAYASASDYIDYVQRLCQLPSAMMVVLLRIPVPMWGWSLMGIVVAAQIVLQARRGVTFGKWICGLRTVRTTRRPCGFARSLVRELLLVVDSLLLVCWLPGVICIVLTKHSQRLGDLVADTVVVKQASSVKLSGTKLPTANPAAV